MYLLLCCDFPEGEESGDAVELNEEDDDVDGLPYGFEGIFLRFIGRDIFCFVFHLFMI